MHPGAFRGCGESAWVLVSVWLWIFGQNLEAFGEVLWVERPSKGSNMLILAMKAPISLRFAFGSTLYCKCFGKALEECSAFPWVLVYGAGSICQNREYVQDMRTFTGAL